MARNSDDTVILRPRRARRPGAGPGVLAAVALLVLSGAGGAGVWLWKQPAPSLAMAPIPTAPAPIPAEPIPVVTEAAMRAQSPAVRTVMRFAANPAVVVIDFPTLTEQGRMLNRMAAWAEKGGVPHDRLLRDTELDAAIQASGTTADTYYYGHDYRGSDAVQFFALADRDGVILRPEEQELRRLVQRAQAEPYGLGALITVVRAEAANDVTPQARGTILHHELSHGEYFTNPAYAAFVDAVWRGVLTPDERAAFRTYLAGEGYDTALEDLMRNEMQAYLMHTPDPQFFDPAKLGIPAGRLAQIRAGFLAGMPPGWLRDAAVVPAGAGPVPGPAHATRPRRRQRPAGRVSRTATVADTVPPRRRRSSMAACRPDR